MIMMPYSWRWSSLQLTGQADFWHPTGPLCGSLVFVDEAAEDGPRRDRLGGFIREYAQVA